MISRWALSLACAVVQCRVLRLICSVDGKHRTLAPCPTKTPSPIQTKFGTVDYVAEFNISAKFDSDRVIGGAPTWGWNITTMCIFLYVCICILYISSVRPQSKPVGRSLRLMAQMTWFGARKCLLEAKITKVQVWGSQAPKTPNIFPLNRESQPKQKCWITCMHGSAMQSVKNDIARRWKTPNFGSLPHKNTFTDPYQIWHDWSTSGGQHLCRFW